MELGMLKKLYKRHPLQVNTQDMGIYRAHELWILRHLAHHTLHVRRRHHVLHQFWILCHLIHDALHAGSLKHGLKRRRTGTEQDKNKHR